MIDLTVWTDQGIVDVVAVSRFVNGETTVKLTRAEALVAYHAIMRGAGTITVTDLELGASLNAGRLKKTTCPDIRRGARSERIILIPTRKAQPCQAKQSSR